MNQHLLESLEHARTRELALEAKLRTVRDVITGIEAKCDHTYPPRGRTARTLANGRCAICHRLDETR
jgi:hypothetical protein